MMSMSVIYGVLKYCVCRLWYTGRFESKHLCVFFRNSKFLIKKNARLILHGKISLSKFSELQVYGQTVIGKNVYINKYSRIIAFESIKIGDNVLIAQFVSILDHDHHYYFEANNIRFKDYNTEAIIIGNNVLIGDKTSILKGTVIGDNVIIGANCLVKGTIPSNSMVVNDQAGIKILKLQQPDLA